LKEEKLTYMHVVQLSEAPEKSFCSENEKQKEREIIFCSL
jgi:hypothetical protein